MTLFLTLVLYASLFVGILLTVDSTLAIVQRVRGTDDPHVKRRVDSLRRGQSTAGGESFTVRRSEKDLPSWARYVPLSGYLDKIVRESGVGTTMPRALMLMAALTLASFLALKAFLAFLPNSLVVILAPLMGIMSIVLYLLLACVKRRRMFEAQLPDALDLIVRSLKVGHPLGSAIAVVAREVPAPLGDEFQIAFAQINYGDEVPQAFFKMNERLRSGDLSYLTMAIQIHYESGGNLAEVLSKLSEVIRDRFRMFRKIRAISTEGRFSAWFLSCFPVAAIFLLQAAKPDYYKQVYDFPYFPHLAAITFILLSMNVVAMKILTNIKV